MRRLHHVEMDARVEERVVQSDAFLPYGLAFGLGQGQQAHSDTVS